MVEDIPLPLGEYVRWASLVTEALADYPIAGPTTEDAWQSWAQQLTGIIELDAPRPDAFASWRDWAVRLYQNLE